jgi:hypothetical protein
MIICLYWRIYRIGRDFNFTVRKISHCTGLVNDKYQAMNELANPSLFKFKMKTKILKLKILQWIHRKFTAIQKDHQNSILFHEAIPLSILMKIK